MLTDILKELSELLEKYPDPRENNGRSKFETRLYHTENPPTYGIVSDNRDPDYLGRVRVQLPLLGENVVSPWYQILNPWAGEESGLWALPDIGTQVIVAFPGENTEHGIVLGCIYDLNHKSPKPSEEADCHLWQTKNHRIEFIDSGKNQGIRIETARGKIRCVLTKDGGIEVANDLGGINIKCRKLTMESGDDTGISAKKIAIKSEGETGIKTNKDAKISCDKKTTLKGKVIRMSGTKGVTAKGKQIAVDQDKVFGMDTHIMVVPAGPSTATVPLPHPFVGKMADKLSTDVKIKGKKVAVKGSTAKHDSPVHMQLPGTIKFQNAPKKESEVTGGTIDCVKVDGKPVAVIGSSVTTCNDIGMRDNSKILAAGMAINMPAIADPLKSEAYEREREKVEEKKEEEKQLDDTFTENPRGETVKDGRKSVYIQKILTECLSH